MKKVLVLTTTYPRWHGDTEPAFVHNLCKELANTFEVHVLAPHTKGSLKSEVLDGISVHRFQYLPEPLQRLAYDGGIVPKLKNNPVLAWQIPCLFLAMLLASVRLIRKQSIDVIHAHWIVPQGFIALLAKRLSRRSPAVLVTSHGADLYSLNHPLLQRLKKSVLNKADSVTVVSRAMKQFCRDQLLVKRPIAVQSMGIDCQTDFVDKTPPQERQGIVFVGRLVGKKGVDVLLQAYHKLENTHPGIPLTIVGDGPKRASLESLASQSRNQNLIQFTGAVNATQVSDHLNRALICVMPSRITSDGDQEGLGLVAGEAIACGCIVIVSNLPAIQDVHNCQALQFDVDDVDALVERLAFVISDPESARNLGSRLKQYVIETFDWSAVGARYTDVVNKIDKGT